MLFAPATRLPVRRDVRRTGAPGGGRAAVVAHIERWPLGRERLDERGGLIVLDVDVDVDDVAPAGGDRVRQRLLGAVERTVSGGAADGDVLGRVDAGRFVLLRRCLPVDQGAGDLAATLGRAVERSIAGRREGHGARITVGAVTLGGGQPRAGREILACVTTAMLRGKLLSTERLVVVVASLGTP